MRNSKKISLLLSNTDGLTLLELCIAMAVFSIGVLAVGSLQLSASLTNRNHNLMTQAKILTQAQLEVFSESDARDLVVGGPINDPNNPIDENGNAGGIFMRSWQVANLTPTSTAARIVTVSVSWTQGGRNRSVSLTSYVRGSGT